MTNKTKQVILEPDVYAFLKKKQEEEGVSIQFSANDSIRKQHGLEKPTK